MVIILKQNADTAKKNALIESLTSLGIEPTERNIAVMESMEYQSV